MSKKRLISLLVVMLLLVGIVTPITNAQGNAVTVTWFVGLGAGGQPEQLEAQNKVVEDFNASHDDVQLEIVIADNDVAYDTLSTLIASGDAPDIVGPVGIRGSNAYSGSWLDLDPVIESTGYDTSRWNPALVDFYRVEGEGLIGLPFAVFPSMIWYNRDLFDEAGLDYPPQEFDAPYADGAAWDTDKLKELALLLTVDANGNDATSPDFDPENIVQFGLAPQWYNDDMRSLVTSPFGAGTFVGEDGTAVMPDNWRAGVEWYYDAMWNSWFVPNYTYQQSDLLSNGNVFASGHVAMAITHLWYTCCTGDVTNWDYAVMPSYDGVYTAKLHADTFRILKATENPEAAFEVLSYLLGEASAELIQVYGGFPADESMQEAALATLNETYPQGVNWQVALDSLSYPDNPSHEGNMPNFNAAEARIKEFQSLTQTTPDLDLNAEIDKLLADLTQIFQEAE